MKRRCFKIQIGMRTIKTAAAVILSMIIVEAYGTTDSKLIFAMLGATAAMQPTFKESLESCITQVVGVLFGAAAGVVLMALPMPMLVSTGIGIVMVITLYNALSIRFSPSMPIFMVVLICATPDIAPMAYAAGRLWDSAIGLGVGMIINTMIFPYDNSRQIRAAVESLDREVIAFLEETFDGDEVLPDARSMMLKVDDIGRQMRIFSDQRLVLQRTRQKQEMDAFARCEEKARLMLAQMEVLRSVGEPGCLNEENRAKLAACGARIRDAREGVCALEKNMVTNYLVSQILMLRQELLRTLGKGQQTDAQD